MGEAEGSEKSEGREIERRFDVIESIHCTARRTSLHPRPCVISQVGSRVSVDPALWEAVGRS